MKTVELKLAKSYDASKKIPNIVILKGKKLAYYNKCNNNKENSELKSFSLKYFGMLNEKLVIASKKFRTTCDMIDMPLLKSQNRKKLKLKQDEKLKLSTYSERSKVSNSEKSKLYFPLLTKFENNFLNENPDYLKERFQKLEKIRGKNKSSILKKNEEFESESDISLKNIKVIDSFKSFKENQVPISFRIIVNKKPLKSHCEIVNGNRYDMKYDTLMEKGVFEMKKNHIDSKSGFEGKKIGEHKNIFLPKYTVRIKTLNAQNDPLIKEEKIQFSYVNGFSLNNNLNILN